MSDLKITKGNTFRTILEIKAYRYDGKEIKDFDLSNCTDITVKCRINGVIREITNFRPRGANELEIQWPSTSKSGAYTIEVSGRLGDHYWRYYSKNPIFTIVETTEEQNIPEDVILKKGTYYVEASKIYLIPIEGSEIKIDPYTYNWIVAGIDTGVSAKGPKGDKGEKGDEGDGVSDYNDLTNKPDLSLVALTGDYNDLFNRPTIPSVPNRLSQLINDAGFITTSNIVKNYYNKTEVDDISNGILQTLPIIWYVTINDDLTLPDRIEEHSYSELINILNSGRRLLIKFGTYDNDQWLTIDLFDCKTTLGKVYLYEINYNVLHELIDGNASVNVTLLAIEKGENDEILIERDLNYDLTKITENAEQILLLLSSKQNTLVSGMNVKTINGQNILGSGNITITAESETYVQELVDWNQSDNSTVDYIKNKPVRLSQFTNDLTTFLTHRNWSEIDSLETPGIYIVQYNSLANLSSDATEDSRRIIAVTVTNSYMYYSGDRADYTYITQVDYTDNRYRTKSIESVAVQTRTDQTVNLETGEETSETEYKYHGRWMSEYEYQSLSQQYGRWSEWHSKLEQADWNNNFDSSPAYIKNKPVLSTVATTGDYNDLQSKPVDVSYFNNDAHYVTESTLSNYYTASYIDTLINNIQAGSTQLTNYYTKTEVDSKFNGYYNKTEVDSKITAVNNRFDDYYTSEYIDTLISNILAGTVDLTNYYTKTEVDDNISVVNNKFTLYYTSTVVDSKLNAKANLSDLKIDTTSTTALSPVANEAIGTKNGNSVVPVKLHKVSKTGDYNDLLNKPTIPAAQVQSDWNAVSGMGVVANKPVLNTVSTTSLSTSSNESIGSSIKLHKISKTGSWNDLVDKPTIPAAQVNADWNATSGVAQILNKPDLSVYARLSDILSSDPWIIYNNSNAGWNILYCDDPTEQNPNPENEPYSLYISEDYTRLFIDNHYMHEFISFHNTINIRIYITSSWETTTITGFPRYKDFTITASNATPTKPIIFRLWVGEGHLFETPLGTDRYAYDVYIVQLTNDITFQVTPQNVDADTEGWYNSN